MKILKLTLVTVLLSFPQIYSQWFWQNPLQQGHILYSVHFTNVNIGWTVGRSGTILKTTNGGTNWISQKSGTTNSLNSVNFVDQNIGRAVGEYGTIINTTNGGTNWILQTSGTTNSLRSVIFIDQNTGWATGDSEQS